LTRTQEHRGQRVLRDGVPADFLWSVDEQGDVAPVAKNNDSLVVRLHCGERRILQPGDAEKPGE
jgi:beta-lactamase superfamily II metal-dependent hydrolase